MDCPNCNKEMKEKEYFTLDWGYGMAGEEVYNRNVDYKCSSCKIEYKGGEWIIPNKFKPTEKQERTLLFINNRLGTSFEPVTKHRCWEIIGKNFEKAKNTNVHYRYEDITDEDCDSLGLDASMFY